MMPLISVADFINVDYNPISIFFPNFHKKGRLKFRRPEVYISISMPWLDVDNPHF